MHKSILYATRIYKKYYFILKFYLEETDIVESLYKMIRDNDPYVLVNALEALKEILLNEGGIAISSKMVIYLLNRLKEFNEWGQASVLGICS